MDITFQVIHVYALSMELTGLNVTTFTPFPIKGNGHLQHINSLTALSRYDYTKGLNMKEIGAIH